MISYDQYENRIKKFAKFKNFMNRFKFLFIAIFALIIAAIATLLALKGSFSGEITIQSTIYGEGYSNPEGVSAFLSSVSYEYAREGSDEWSEQKPIKAGKYSVRAVSNKTIGKGYGKTTSFEIAPREVTFTILSDSMEYGGVPNEYSLELLAGDKLEPNELLFEYEDYVASTTEVNLIESSVKITNGTDDRSSCYTVKHEWKTLDITKRSIEGSLQRFDYVYSGKAISYSAAECEQTSGMLANGDRIEFGSVQLSKNGEKVENAVYAGTYKAIAQDIRIYKKINGREVEVTGQYQYDPSSFSVSFEIEQKSLTVQTASAEKEYDGAELRKSDGYKVTGLAQGDNFTVSESTLITSVQQSAYNKFIDYEIKNAAGVDVLANYDIDWEYGTLIVKPREITIRSDSGSWEYDGNGYSLVKVSFKDNLFEAVEIETPKTTVTTVGKVPNAVDYIIRNKKGDTEDKANFAIKEEWGTLEIAKRDITITIQDVSRVYDSMPLYASPENGEVKVTGGTLGKGDELVSDLSNGARKELIDVYKENGVVKGITNGSNYKIICAGGDRTENYNIRYVRGTLTVYPIHITLLTESQEFVYNGKPHSNGGYKIYEDGVLSALYAGNAITLDGSAPAFTNVSETEGKTENNKCAYTVGDNYVIDKIEYGTITILQREITVTTNSRTFVYNGKAHSDGGYTTSYNGETGLVGGDKLTLIGPAPTVTNVSDTAEHNNVCRYNVPNNNYKIADFGYEYGTLAVTERMIWVATASAEKIYDGKELSNNTYVKTYYIDENNQEQAGLLNGDRLTLQTAYSITEVKQSGKNTCKFNVPSENYLIINYEYGTLNIKPRPITVVTASAEPKVYDGKSLSNNKYIETYYLDEDGKKQTGVFDDDQLDKLTLIKSYYITNVNESGDNVCEFSAPENYEILDYVYGTLTITPKPVTVKVKDVDALYGEGYDYPIEKGNFECEEGYEFVGNDTLTLTAKFDLLAFEFSKEEEELIRMGRLPVRWEGPMKWVQVGSYEDDGYEIGGYEDAVQYVSSQFSGSDADNYKITYKSGTLYILRRVLHVMMADATTFYGEDLYQEDGRTAVYPKGEGNVKHVSVDDSKVGLLDGDTLEILDVSYTADIAGSTFVEPKNVGVYYIRPYEILVRTSYGEELTMDKTDGDCQGNYLMHYYASGKLTIKPRPIVVTLNEMEERCYDGSIRMYNSGNEKIRLDLVSADDDASYLMKEDGLVYGEKLNVRVIFDGVPMYAGTYHYSFDEKNSTIEVDGAVVEGGLKNYSITPVNGVLTITKRPVTVKMIDWECVYGDTDYPDEVDAIDSVTNLVKGDSVATISVIYDCGTKPSVGDYKNKIIGSNAVIMNYIDNGTDGYTNITDSYDITYVSGTLTVLEKDVSIVVWTRTSVYGYVGDVVSNPYDISELAYGETISIKWSYSQNGVTIVPKDAGIYDVTAIPELSVGAAGLKNYHITYRDSSGEELENATLEGGLVINKLLVTVTVVPQSVVYGDDIGESTIEVSPNPLPYDEKLSVNLYVEKDGEKFTPIHVGTYDIAIGDEWRINGSADGVKNYVIIAYKDQGKLTITPRPITINLEKLSLIYGNPVEYGEDDIVYTLADGSTLAYKDQLSVATYFDLSKTNAERPDAGYYPITVPDGGISVCNGEGKLADGDDKIEDDYKIKIVDSELSIALRYIEVTLNPMSNAYYNGKAHEYATGNEVIGGMGMAEDETLVVKVKYYSVAGNENELVEAIVKAGTYVCEFDILSSSVEGGNEKISNYIISPVSSDCEIYQRRLTVTLIDIGTKEYGTPISYPEEEDKYYESISSEDGGLVDGETLIVGTEIYKANGGAWAGFGVLPVGLYEIVGQINDSSVTGSDYADINNYDITFISSTFEVVKKKLKVTLCDVSTDYGEEPVYAGNYVDIEGLAEYETFTVEEVEYIYFETSKGVNEHAGEVTLKRFTIMRGTNDVSGNYEVEDLAGNLAIEKRDITITTNTATFVYNADAQMDGGYTITYDKDPEKGLAIGDTAAIHEDFVGKIPSVTDVKDSGKGNFFQIAITNGNADASGNYNITYQYGTLSISKRVIYFSTESQTQVYDGTPLYTSEKIGNYWSHEDNDPEKKRVEGLVGGHEFSYESKSIVNVGQIDNNPITGIWDGDVSKMDNYAFSPVEIGKLTILVREISVYADNHTQIYNGDYLTPLPNEQYELKFYDSVRDLWFEGDDVLVSGHSFRMKSLSIKDAGSIDNNPYDAVLDENGVQSDNYKITWKSGSLTVTPRAVYYQVYDYTMDYCNAAPSTDEINHGIQTQDGDEGVLDDEAATFAYEFVFSDPDNPKVSRYNAGTYKITLTTANNNYVMLCMRAGTLTINTVKLSLKPNNKKAYYESIDQVLTMTLEDLVIDGLVGGDIITDAGYSKNTLKASDNSLSLVVNIQPNKVVIQDGSSLGSSGGVNIAKNYDISVKSGALQFKPRTLYVQQIVPDYIEKDANGRGLLPYTGKTQTISGGNELFYVLAKDDIQSGKWDIKSNDLQYYGLLGSNAEKDEIQFKSASVSSATQVYKQWVQLNIMSAKTKKSISNLYKISYVNLAGKDSSIEVLSVDVSVSLSSALTWEYINSDKFGDGITVLDSAFVTAVTCNSEFFKEGYQVDAAICKKNGTVSLYIFIYEARTVNGEIRRTDRSSIFAVNVNFESGIEGLNVKLSNVVYYPTGEQGD